MSISAIQGHAFNWAVGIRPNLAGGEDEIDLIAQPGLLVYSGRQGLLPGGVFQVGGLQDQIALNNKDSYGVFAQIPARQLYFKTEIKGLSTDSGLYIIVCRFDFDVVSLSTSEQAELYRDAGCCC